MTVLVASIVRFAAAWANAEYAGGILQSFAKGSVHRRHGKIKAGHLARPSYPRSGGQPCPNLAT